MSTTYPIHTPSASAYSKGCRCCGCRVEHRVYERTRKRLRSRPDSTGPSFVYVSAREAQAHLQWLASQGLGVRLASKASGVSKYTLQSIRSGKVVTIRSTTNKKILAINTATTKPRAGKHPYNQPTYQRKDK